MNNNLLIYNDLSFRVGKFVFNLPILASRITIGGYSGTGKTLMLNLLKTITGDTSTFGIIGEMRKDFVFIDYNDTHDTLRRELFENHGKIIFIDNADLLLHENKDVYKLDESENQLIIFGRDYSLYGVPLKNTTELLVEGTTFTLDYF